MRSTLGVALMAAVLVAACSAAPAGTTTPAAAAPTTATAAPPTSVAAAPPATTAAASTSTTTTTTTSTTTTTLPPLDRTREAAAERIVADVATLVAFGPRVEGSEAEARAGDWIAARLVDIAGSTESMRVDLPNGLHSRNLWVTFGDPASGPWTLLGAHYDSITGSPGADDNASGTAILLELTARLAEAPPPTGAVTVILFGAEEVHPGHSRSDHHYGSRQWVASRLDHGRPLPDLMVSVDMVGVGDALYGVAYTGTSVAAVDALVAAADSVGLTVGRLDKGDISDHEPFALAGVPAAMLWRPSNPNYHGPGDTAVDAPEVTDVLTVVEALIARVHG